MIVEKIKGKRRGLIVVCICDNCKKEYTTQNYKIEHFCKQHQFCSRICWREWFKNNNPHLGKKRSDKAKEQMSISGKKKIFTDEHKKNISLSITGRISSDETKLKLSIANSGSKNAMWKGGRIKTGMGYIYIFKPEHPFATKRDYVLEHRLVMEKYLGRYLKPKEVVHHEGEKDDNRIEKLMLFADNVKHKEYHKMLEGKIA